MAIIMDDKRKYKGMDVHLEEIGGKFITFPESTIKRNNQILEKVVDPLITIMRANDPLFDQLYNKKFFGGSYYDGLKVGKPDEYDLDLLLKMPKSQQLEIRTGDVPGFVNLYLENSAGFGKFCNNDEDSFLDTNKVLSWMEGVISKSFNTHGQCWYIFGDDQAFDVNFYKSGPAFTLTVADSDTEEEIMNIDLVPCFSFSGKKWPRDGFAVYADDDSNLADFFVVPKKPKGIAKDESKYWRLSFQIQERDFIHDKGRLKPALRLLKKMRDTMEYKQISSYYLKTVVLWEALEYNSYFWTNNSLSYIFMHLLKKYQESLSNKEIRYFWNDDFNLLNTVHKDFLINVSNRLRRIINDIERNLSTDPGVVKKYILTSDELEELHSTPKNTYMGQHIQPQAEYRHELNRLHRIPKITTVRYIHHRAPIQEESSSCVLL